MGHAISILQNHTADFQDDKQGALIINLKEIIIGQQTGWIPNNDKAVGNVDNICFQGKLT